MPHLSAALLKPSTWKAPVQAARSLWFDYAHVRSAAIHQAVDADGRAVPWYTYPAIEYLRQLDFSDKTVFEYGSGNSTLFWGASATRVVSAEEDERWYAALKAKLPANCELVLETDLTRYVDIIRRYPDGFDVIVVDGAARGRTRLKCSHAAIECLRPGGLIILDNSDWLPESSRVLRDSGLIQVDMTGFVPINGNTQTTSLFFHREFVTRPKGPRLPQPGPGATDKNWERLAPPEPPFVTIGEDTLSRVDQDRLVTFETPSGPRQLRVLGGKMHGDAGRWSVLADNEQQRVVIYLSEGEDPGEIERQVDAAAGNWTALQAWVRQHHRRRFLL
jgi:Methyltransferase domain